MAALKVGMTVVTKVELWVAVLVVLLVASTAAYLVVIKAV